MDPRTIRISDPSLVVLLGASGAGKTTFAHRHFKKDEILSSDRFREMVSGRPDSNEATKDAFDALHFVAERRLERKLLTVIDATNTSRHAQDNMVEMARRHHVRLVPIVLQVPFETACEHNEKREDRHTPKRSIRHQHNELARSIKQKKRRRIAMMQVLDGTEEIEHAIVVRQPIEPDRRTEHGPFDIIGDVHGCHDELLELLEKLGHRVERGDDGWTSTHEEGRRIIWVGDLTDRGPKSPEVLELAMDLVRSCDAICVEGNHDAKLGRALAGANVKVGHGLEKTLEQMKGIDEEALARMREFLQGLPSHVVLDGGRLVVAHAGLTPDLHLGISGRVRAFARYGQTSGESDEFGLPVRYAWAKDYEGKACVVYGHTPVETAQWDGRTICIDTGACFGGSLTALRWPERETVSVEARQEWYPPVRPIRAAQAREHENELSVEQVLGRRRVQTREHGWIRIDAERSGPAAEVLGRFGVDPKWLFYLPPTMAPPQSPDEGRYLEHPRQALEHYRHHGVTRIVCEKKHMGSRAIVIAGRDEEAIAKVFGLHATGTVYSRTGRKLFDDEATRAHLIDAVREAMTRNAMWEELQTDWIALDCELLPWSARARRLIDHQYRRTAQAARMGLDEARQVMTRGLARNAELEPVLAAVRTREEDCARFEQVLSVYDRDEPIRIAPFHVLASQGQVLLDRPHAWHMGMADRLSQGAAAIEGTPWMEVDLDRAQDTERVTKWWQRITEDELDEGIVVKPAEGGHKDAQPAIKCRGREYLRIIYGMQYTEPGQMERLRRRNTGVKSSLAKREHALGMEGLRRFVSGAPIGQVYECTIGVLGLESEPIDPRL